MNAVIERCQYLRELVANATSQDWGSEIAAHSADIERRARGGTAPSRDDLAWLSRQIINLENESRFGRGDDIYRD